MLTETFVSAVLPSSAKSKSTSIAKDVGIHFHEFQPTPALRTSFKKSSTPTNCLAVSASHVFAAQAEKAVVHIYSRERGNQEAIVPFPERIRSVALAGEDDGGGAGGGVLVLGTEEGRLILWEICTGRSISTPQSHLQAVTTIAVDPTSQFLLSGSPDSTIHVWSLPALLSFVQPSYTDPTQPSPRSPLRSLSHHRAAITHLVLGHGSSATNIAVSASQDNTCIVWDYHAGTPLKTYLLPSTPLCLALDPADRAVYAGHEDGSIQLLDFYKTPTLTNPLYDPAQQSTPAQASPRDRWPPPNENLGAVLSLAVNYDGTALITGHQSGKIVSWDVAKGRYVTDLADLAAPVTNLRMLSPTGFPHAAKPNFTVHNVVKPRYEAALSNGAGEDGAVPMNYNFSAHFTSALDVPRVTATDALASRPTAFEAALEHACFPTELLDEGLRELAAWDLASSSTTTNKSAPLPPSTGLDGANDHVPPNSTEAEMSSSEITDLRSQIADLNALVQAQHRTQKWTWEKLLELNAWRYKREKSERGRDRDRDGEVVSNGVGKGVEKWVDDDGGEGGGRGEVEVRDGEEEEEEMDSVDEDEEEEDEDEDEMP